MSDTVSAEIGEARRQARLATRSAGSYSGTQVVEPLGAGEMSGGVFLPYGRVGITEPKNGFLPRRG